MKILDEIRIKSVEWRSTPEGKLYHSKLAKSNWENMKKSDETCSQCGKVYNAYTSYIKKRFCSTYCHNQNRYYSTEYNEARVCVLCNNTFSIHKDRKNITCNRSCAAKLRAKNKKINMKDI